MPEITRRRCGELLRKLFNILMDSPEGLSARTALERLANAVQLTEYEAGIYESGSRRFEKIVRFGTVDCVKAGWLVKHKGTWTLTDAGLEAYRRWADPEDFYREAVRLYREWKKGQKGGAQETTDATPSVEADDADKSSSITFEQAEEQAWGEIEAHVAAMDPYEVQKLVADLLKAMGYYPSWVSPPGKDGGLDIIAYPDPLGTRPPRIKVQVKRQQQRVSREGVSAFLAHVNEEDAGLFVCIGGFTRDAEDFARMQERRKITLIDLERLVDLWIEFSPKLDDLARERLPLTPIYFLTPKA
jgi:restriction system protein